MRHPSYDGARGCYIEAALDVIANKWGSTKLAMLNQ
jgi:hypothetical protein